MKTKLIKQLKTIIKVEFSIEEQSMAFWYNLHLKKQDWSLFVFDLQDRYISDDWEINSNTMKKIKDFINQG